MPTKLVRSSPGLYKTEDDLIFVSRHEGRTWNPREGSHAFTTWNAYLPAALHAELEAARAEGRAVHDNKYEVAKADTLTKLRTRLDKYLTDRAAGTLGTRSKYGWPGDNRMVAS